MDLDTFIVAVFCLTDDWVEGQELLRQRGPTPKLCDTEVLTIEMVGEFLGIDTEEGLYTYFRRHYGEWFPALRRIHRTTFTRQMANLWVLTKRLWRHLLERISYDPKISLIDSFPVPTCRFARAYRCRDLAEESTFVGYDEMSKQTFLGLRARAVGLKTNTPSPAWASSRTSPQPSMPWPPRAPRRRGPPHATPRRSRGPWRCLSSSGSSGAP